MEQRQWITRALEGDRTAKAHLFEENIQNVYYLCMKLTGSGAQAGELTRRTFARAFSHLGEMRPDASFDRWVTAIAVNLCRQTMKKAQPWLFTTDEREMAALSDTYVADEACLPPDCTENPDLRTQALRTISLLPPEQRVAMVLRYAALMKPHQIAKTLDVDEVTVLGRLNCGRRALMTALPCPNPEPLLPFLFAGESSSTSVPEVLRGSCMQTVMNTQPEPVPQTLPDQSLEPVPESEVGEDEEAPAGFLKKLTKKQKILFSGIGATLALAVLILVLVLVGGKKDDSEPPVPEPASQPAVQDEVEEDAEPDEIAEKLKSEGVECLLGLTNSASEKLRNDESWHNALNAYVADGDWQDLELNTKSPSGVVSEVSLRLDKTNLEITRLKGVSDGEAQDLNVTKEKIEAAYSSAHCYRDLTPLFDPTQMDMEKLFLGVYYDGCRYELQDEDFDGNADYLIITPIGEANYDAEKGVFQPYGTSLTALMGKSKSEAEGLLGQGEYDGEDSDRYVMKASGATADGEDATVRVAMQARSHLDASAENVNTILLEVDGCFSELLPELQLPEDRAMSIENLKNKLVSGSGAGDMIEGDVFRPLVYEDGWSYVVCYKDNFRYFFCAESIDDPAKYVEVLDLSDCKLWDASSLSFKRDGFDLQELLGLDRWTAYARYGIQTYYQSDFSSLALKLEEEDGAINTVRNCADPKALWGVRLGDSQEAVEAKVEQEGGYLTADESVTRYVIPGSRELVVTYSDGKAAELLLEDHSRETDYQPPERRRKPSKELFEEFLAEQTNVYTSQICNLTREGEDELLICRKSGLGYQIELYVIGDDEVVQKPIYTKNIYTGLNTDLYLLEQEDGPALLFYTLSEGLANHSCSWKLVYFNAAGDEIALDQGEGSYMFGVLSSTEEFDAAKEKAEAYAAEGTFLCGTQSRSVVEDSPEPEG